VWEAWADSLEKSNGHSHSLGNATWKCQINLWERSHPTISQPPNPTLSWVFAHHPGRPGKPKAAHGNPSAAGWMQGVCSSAAG